MCIVKYHLGHLNDNSVLYRLHPWGGGRCQTELEVDWRGPVWSEGGKEPQFENEE